MITNLIFVFTAAMVLTGSVKMLGHILGNGISLPYVIPVVEIAPTHFLLWYPSLMYQVWFWATHAGLLT